MGHGPPDPEEYKNSFYKLTNFLFNVLDTPTTWVRENVVKPNQQDYNWYHKKFRRVPTIDQCYTDDRVCRFEADQQFRRDKRVENNILVVLRRRFEDCVITERPDDKEICQKLLDQYKDAETNWFIKYGDLGAYGTSKDALMKQKHRIAWERRYGPVGTGNTRKTEAEA